MAIVLTVLIVSSFLRLDVVVIASGFHVLRCITPFSRSENCFFFVYLSVNVFIVLGGGGGS